MGCGRTVWVGRTSCPSGQHVQEPPRPGQQESIFSLHGLCEQLRIQSCVLGTCPGLFSSLLPWHLQTAAPVKCPQPKGKVCYHQSGAHVGLGWLLCETNQLGCTGQIISQKAKFSCPSLDGVTIRKRCSFSDLEIGQKLLLCPYGPTRTCIELSMERK